MKSFRHTRITFTIGPATESESQLEAIIQAGANVVRIRDTRTLIKARVALLNAKRTLRNTQSPPRPRLDFNQASAQAKEGNPAPTNV